VSEGLKDSSLFVRRATVDLDQAAEPPTVIVNIPVSMWLGKVGRPLRFNIRGRTLTKAVV